MSYKVGFALMCVAFGVHRCLLAAVLTIAARCAGYTRAGSARLLWPQ